MQEMAPQMCQVLDVEERELFLLLLCSVMNKFYSKIHILKGLHALECFFSLGDR